MTATFCNTVVVWGSELPLGVPVRSIVDGGTGADEAGDGDNFIDADRDGAHSGGDERGQNRSLRFPVRACWAG